MKQTQDNKILKYNSIFLGVFMFLFGFLKLFEPFHTWFDIQITKSGLPRFSIQAGKAGEIAIGLGLLSASSFRQKIPNLYSPILFAASAGLVVNMGIATYVHLQPEVPANVLPLGIKPPFIPLFVMFLAAVNLYQLYRDNTFWAGINGWSDAQWPDGTIMWTAPSGQTYATRPGSRLLFPNLCVPTGELPTAPTVERPPGPRGVMMPRRRRTREQDRAYRIDAERALNAARVAERNKPPPF